MTEPVANDWRPTHYSTGDGSVVRLVTEVPFVIENEDGERWEDDPSLWVRGDFGSDEPCCEFAGLRGDYRCRGECKGRT